MQPGRDPIVAVWASSHCVLKGRAQAPRGFKAEPILQPPVLYFPWLCWGRESCRNNLAGIVPDLGILCKGFQNSVLVLKPNVAWPELLVGLSQVLQPQDRQESSPSQLPSALGSFQGQAWDRGFAPRLFSFPTSLFQSLSRSALLGIISVFRAGETLVPG